METEMETEEETEEETQVEIYRKELKQIGDLVISRGPDRPVSEWAFLLPEGARPESNTNCYSIRIDLHLRNAAPLTLASFLHGDPTGQGEYEVLDALFYKGAFVIATVQNGDIVLTRIYPRGSEPVVSSALSPRVWTKAAASVRLDRTMVNVKLDLTPDGLVVAEVDDLRSNLRQHTRFIQDPDKWAFVEYTGP